MKKLEVDVMLRDWIMLTSIWLFGVAVVTAMWAIINIEYLTRIAVDIYKGYL